MGQRERSRKASVVTKVSGAPGRGLPGPGPTSPRRAQAADGVGIDGAAEQAIKVAPAHRLVIGDVGEQQLFVDAILTVLVVEAALEDQLHTFLRALRQAVH